MLTVTTDTLRFLAGSRASPGHRSAASTDSIQAEVADTPVMHNNRLCHAIYSVTEEVL